MNMNRSGLFGLLLLIYSCNSQRKPDAGKLACTDSEFRCDDPENKCIAVEKHCDGKTDCPNGKDEFNCTQALKTQCSFGTCTQFCDKPKASSKPQCLCAPGFTLLEDGFNCKSNASDEPFLLYTNRYDIRLTRLERHADQTSLESERQSLPLLSHLKNVIALDYFYNHTDGSSQLFWSDISLDQIFCGRLHQGILSDIRPVVTYGVWTAEGLAVDYIGRHVYWIDSQLGHILVTNFDGSMTTTVISGNMQNLRALALDPNEGLLFWSDWFEKFPRIERASMAGTQRQVLFEIRPKIVGGGWPNGLTCDYIVKRLYFIDAKSDSVHSVRYDGSDHHQILRDPTYLGHPFAITVFENFFYFSDWKTKAIYRANKWTGSNLEVAVEESLNQPFDLKVVHSSRQLVVNNPCANHKCSHLCLIESSDSFKCACPYTFKFLNDSTKCVQVNQTLLLATEKTIDAVDIDDSKKNVFPVLSASQENITALAVFPDESTIYWADNNFNSIYMLELKDTSQTHPRVFIKKMDAINCYGIAVDNQMGQVYYTGWTTGKDRMTTKSAWIRVAKKDGLYMTVIDSARNSSLQKPYSLVFKDGKLFWFDQERLFSANADGSRHVELKLKPEDVNATKNAQSLAIDDKWRLVWTQPQLNLTRLLDLQTMTVHTLRFEDNPNASLSLVAVDSFTGEFLFYERFSGNISGRFKQEGEGIQLSNSSRLLRTNVQRLVSMKLLEREGYEERVKGLNQRQFCKALRCDHFCLRSPGGCRCACADGYRLISMNSCKLPLRRLLLLNSNFDIFWISTDQSNLIAKEPILNNLNTRTFQPHYITYNERTIKLYFVDSILNELWEYNLVNKEQKKLLEGGAAHLTSVVVDSGSGYIYVSSYMTAAPLRPRSTVIQVLHPLYGDLRKDIVYLVNDTISSLKVDSNAGYLFWVSLHGIGRSRLDGTHVQQVLKQNRFVYRLTLDCDNQRLFYLNMVSSTIFSVDYDGNNFRTIPRLFNLTKTVTYESIFVSNKTLYFAGQRQLRSVKLSKGVPLNETNTLLRQLPVSTLLLEGPTSMRGNTGGKCVRRNCEQLCFNMGPDQEPRCDCVFSRLNEDGISCERYTSFLAYAIGSKIEFTTTFDEQEDYRNVSVDSELNRREVQALKPIQTLVKAPVAIVADVERRFLFVSDIQTEQILAIPFNQSTRLVVAQNVQRVEGMAYDEINKNLYFSSDKAIQRVGVQNLSNDLTPVKPIVILELDKGDLIRGIAVDPCLSIIFFSNWRVDRPVIERVDFNGSNRRSLVTERIQTPNAIAIDHKTQKLYWLDARLDKIERMNLDGRSREVVLSAPENMTNTGVWSRAFPAHPFALAVYANRLYYTDWIHRAVLSVDKLLGNDVTQHRINLLEQPMGLAVVAEDLPVCSDNVCAVSKLKCEDICLVNAENDTAECHCFDNRILNPDGRTCKDEMPNQCAEDMLRCANRLECYFIEQHCDGQQHCTDGSDEKGCDVQKELCQNLCLNNGTCAFEMGLAYCHCSEEFTGLYCQYEKCSNFCEHGTCSINKYNGLPECSCHFGWTGRQCTDKQDFCNEFCFNNGTCQEATNGIHCTCSSDFSGLRCQNCRSSITGEELICQNGGYCSGDRKACKCRNKFSGDHCELDFCYLNPNYCKNGGVCVHTNSLNASISGVKCLCPSQFTGPTCEQLRSCSSYCLNGASCKASSFNNELECHCANGFYGTRCEHNYECGLDCVYGECVQVKNTHLCKCPPGISLITDYLGHKSCTQYTARNCSQLKCVNGECVENLQKDVFKTSCVCEDGWTGVLCELPSCYNYCALGAECFVMDMHPYCKCSSGQFGTRCNQRVGDYNFVRNRKATSRSMFIMLPLILIVFGVVVVAYFSVLKKHGISFIGVQKQFQHVRMLDEELASEFQNPAFSNDEETSQSQHLIDGGVYNDTVLRNGSSSSSSALPLSLPNVEQFNLLSKTG